MTKLLASLFVLALLMATIPVQACPFNDQKTAESAPVVTSDAAGAAPMTPVPPPPTTTTPKTGG